MRGMPRLAEQALAATAGWLHSPAAPSQRQGGQQQESGSSGRAQCASAEVVAAAAAVFGGVLAADGSIHAVALTRQTHAVVRPLWQQRTYTSCASLLLQSLTAGAASQPGGGTAAGRDDPTRPADMQAVPALQPEQRDRLLLGLANLLVGVPPAILQHDMRRMLPWLLECLSSVQAGAASQLSGGQLLVELSTILSSALMTETGARTLFLKFFEGEGRAWDVMIQNR
jgi:hypothetical protein